MSYVQVGEEEEEAEPATLKFFPLGINNRNQTLHDVIRYILLKSLSVEKNKKKYLSFADISISM